MAIVSAATFKTQVATMATALTAAWKDSVKTEVAGSIANPLHGLRRVEKFFNFNSSTGVVTSDDGYIDAVYAGETPNKPNALSVITKEVMALSTATVEDASPTIIVLTFDQTITEAQNVSVGGDAAPAKTISGISIAGAVVSITVNTAYINADTITVTGTFLGQRLNSILFEDQAVTNNVAA